LIHCPKTIRQGSIIGQYFVRPLLNGSRTNTRYPAPPGSLHRNIILPLLTSPQRKRRCDHIISLKPPKSLRAAISFAAIVCSPTNGRLLTNSEPGDAPAQRKLDRSLLIHYNKDIINRRQLSYREHIREKGRKDMPSNGQSSRELPGTYFVQDRSNEAEVMRLQVQDQLITAGMGGILAEQPDAASLQRVLDVGCGTGGWLLEAARMYPTIMRLVGVDVNTKLLDFARAQAEKQQINDRVEFYAMNALIRLDFPPSSFDLVNQRLGMSFLRTWDWPQILGEYRRVLRTGGIVRITESSFPTSESAALNSLRSLFIRTLSQAGHLFVPDDPDGVISELPHLLRRHGFARIQSRLHTLEQRAGTPEGQSFYEDTQHLFRNLLPFFRKWSHVPDNYEDIYQQALHDIQQPGFVATWKLLTVWGHKA